MPIRFSMSGRVFAPTWPMTTLTVVLFVGFIALGRWQWQRGMARQAIWDEYQRNSSPVEVPDGELDRVERFTRVVLKGHFEPAHQFVLDNRSHDGQPGYEVLTPFVLASGRRVLVDRGWVAFTGYRDRLPDVSLADDAPRSI